MINYALNVTVLASGLGAYFLDGETFLKNLCKSFYYMYIYQTRLSTNNHVMHRKKLAKKCMLITYCILYFKDFIFNY